MNICDDGNISLNAGNTDTTEEEEQEDGSGSHLQGLAHLETKRVKLEEPSETSLISFGGYSLNM